MFKEKHLLQGIYLEGGSLLVGYWCFCKNKIELEDGNNENEDCDENDDKNDENIPDHTNAKNEWFRTWVFQFPLEVQITILISLQTVFGVFGVECKFWLSCIFSLFAYGWVPLVSLYLTFEV